MGSIVQKIKQHRFALVCLGAALIIGVMTAILVARYNAEHSPIRGSVHAQGETPPFSAVLPKDRTIDALGGWQKLTPPKGASYYVYVDKIDEVPINVSQQPLPESLKNDTDTKIASLAKDYNATTKLDADGTTAYLGTSAKGPQSVILTKDDLLILIKSEKKIQNNSWVRYISSLK